MKDISQVFLLFLVSSCFGLSGVFLAATPANASNAGGLPACKSALNVCTADLATCNADLTACQSSSQAAFPGDGYPNPDQYGVSGHGPALNYTDNGDGTFTDNVTKLMWEEKTSVAGSIHDVNNCTYAWTNGVAGSAADGPLFTVFLHTLNNSCAGDETKSCASDTDCTGIGNGKCGFAGHRDWRIPNIKELQSIVDYSAQNPAIASSVPGFTKSSFYWSATSNANASFSIAAWNVPFDFGAVSFNRKDISGCARAVRL